MGVSYDVLNRPYVGGLFPACRIDAHAQHQMVFGKESLQYLPKDSKPLYVMK